MRVIYRGRLPVLVTEYNGVRYSLVKNTSKDIPVKVYDNVKSSGHVMAEHLVPDIESYEKEIVELKIQINEGGADPKPIKVLQTENEGLRKENLEYIEKNNNLKKEKDEALKEAQLLAKEVKRLQKEIKDGKKARTPK